MFLSNNCQFYHRMCVIYTLALGLNRINMTISERCLLWGDRLSFWSYSSVWLGRFWYEEEERKNCARWSRKWDPKGDNHRPFFLNDSWKYLISPLLLHQKSILINRDAVQVHCTFLFKFMLMVERLKIGLASSITTTKWLGVRANNYHHIIQMMTE